MTTPGEAASFEPQEVEEHLEEPGTRPSDHSSTDNGEPIPASSPQTISTAGVSEGQQQPGAAGERGEPAAAPRETQGGGGAAAGSPAAALPEQEPTRERSTRGGSSASTAPAKKPAQRHQVKGRGRPKEDTSAAAAKKAGAGAGAESNDSEDVQKKGMGKRPRAGQGHVERGRKEEAAAEEEEERPIAVNPAVEKLWSTCASHFAPIKKSDEAFLREKGLEILTNWGVDPAAMQRRAANHVGTFLNPSMGAKEVQAALEEEMCEELKLGPIIPLGRPYMDVWMEESYTESLEQRSLYRDRDGHHHHHQHHQQAGAPAARGAATPTGASTKAAEADSTAAAAAAGAGEGERRSLRAGGRRHSGFGAGSFLGGASAASAGLGHGTPAWAGGGAANGGGVGGGEGEGAGVVLPCVGPVRDWGEIVKDHDEALFRQSLLTFRHRRGFPGKKGFYCPNDLDEEDDWEAERAAKVAAFEVPSPTARGDASKGDGAHANNVDGSSRARRKPQSMPTPGSYANGGSVEISRPAAAAAPAGSGNSGTASNGAVGSEEHQQHQQQRREKTTRKDKREQRRRQQGKEDAPAGGGEGGEGKDKHNDVLGSDFDNPHNNNADANTNANANASDTCLPSRRPRKLKRGPSRTLTEIVASLHAAAFSSSSATGGTSCGATSASAPPGTSSGAASSSSGSGVTSGSAAKGKVCVSRGGSVSGAREEGGSKSAAAAVGKRSSVRLRGGGAGALGAAAAAETACQKGEEATAAEAEEGSGEEDDDEVCRELKRVWRQLCVCESEAVCRIYELDGVSRQERLVFQSVFDRADEAKDLVCSAHLLSEVHKGGAERRAKNRKHKVGLPEDFPYHDPSEEPVAEARRKQTEAHQHHQRNQEDMGAKGCTQAEIDKERAKRERLSKKATATAEAKEREWKKVRLAVGRKGQTGRGRGIPVPGGVAHPFLLGKEEADYLYSISMGDEVEAKDEWGQWSRATVVAVRGEGGWDPDEDTNVLRAVKVSFHGWGPVMDAWYPVDSGMVAKPGTHRPLLKQQRARAAESAAATVAGKEMSGGSASATSIKRIKIRAFHGPKTPSASPPNGVAAAASSDRDVVVDHNDDDLPMPRAAVAVARGVGGRSRSRGGSAAGKRKRPAGEDRRESKRAGAAATATATAGSAAVEGASFGGLSGYVGAVVAAAAPGRAGSNGGDASSSSSSDSSSGSGSDNESSISGYSEGNNGKLPKAAASYRQHRKVTGGGGDGGGSGTPKLGTIASRLRCATTAGNGGGGDGVGSGAGEWSAATAPRAEDCLGKRKAAGGGADRDRGNGRPTRGRASVVLHPHQGKTTSHPRDCPRANATTSSCSSARTAPVPPGSPSRSLSNGSSGSLASSTTAAATGTGSPYARRSGRVVGVANDMGGSSRWADVGTVNWGNRRNSGSGGKKSGFLSSSTSTSPVVTSSTATTPTTAVISATGAGGDGPRAPRSGTWTTAITSLSATASATAAYGVSALGRISPGLNRLGAGIVATSPSPTPAAVQHSEANGTMAPNNADGMRLADAGSGGDDVGGSAPGGGAGLPPSGGGVAEGNGKASLGLLAASSGDGDPGLIAADVPRGQPSLGALTPLPCPDSGSPSTARAVASSSPHPSGFAANASGRGATWLTFCSTCSSPRCLVCVNEFDEDSRVLEDMVMIGRAVAARKKRGKGGKTGTVVVDAEALWSMLYADDAGVVSRSPEGLEEVMSIIVRVAGLFGLMFSEPKTEIMCMLPRGMEERPFAVRAGGRTYKQTDRFVYLGRTITADGKMDKEIASRICRAWKCFRRYSEATYDRRRIDHRLKTIEATVRKRRRLCFAGFVMRMEDDRLPKRVLLGTLATGKGYRGGQESDWVSHLGEDLVAFGTEDEKEGEKWKKSTLEQEDWFGKIEAGITMRSFATLGLLVSATVINTAGMYTLEVSTCDWLNADSGNTVNFYTCSGGPDCTMPSTPTATHTFSSAGGSATLTISASIEPTTLLIEKPGSDGCDRLERLFLNTPSCVVQVKWEGEDVLAPSTELYIDVEDGGWGNCAGGIINYVVSSVPELQYDNVYLCLEGWRFFNLQKDPTFEYELVVDGCDGANTPLVTVYFCPDIYCNTSDVVIKTFHTFNAGSTTFNIELDFNPTAIKFLPFVDEW
eukprot:g16196.t1